MSRYRLHCRGDTYELVQPVFGQRARLIATIVPKMDPTGTAPVGWRFRPETVMNGPVTKVWPTVADALVGFRIASPAKARKAVAAADDNEPPLPL